MFGFHAHQLLTGPRPMREPVPVGPIVTPLCDVRSCPNRTAPVFLVLGARGALTLCTACRDRHHRIVQAALPELKREAR